MTLKTLCITLGDPGGLGPELVVRHFLDVLPATDERVLLIGPKLALDRELERCGETPFFKVLDNPSGILDKEAGVYQIGRAHV